MPFIENQGARIYWDQQGSGDPVLLVMGLAYPSDMWYRTQPVLAGQPGGEGRLAFEFPLGELPT